MFGGGGEGVGLIDAKGETFGLRNAISRFVKILFFDPCSSLRSQGDHNEKIMCWVNYTGIKGLDWAGKLS